MTSKRATILFNSIPAGIFTMLSRDQYTFEYFEDYQGSPISLTMPISQRHYEFTKFPAFFEGLLPEGQQLEALLRLAKLDRYDYFNQLLTVGKDMVGAVTVEVLP